MPTCCFAALLAATAVELGTPTPVVAPRLSGHVLDVALVGGHRLLALTTDELALLRIEDGALREQSRRPLPAPLAPVRKPGGLILPAQGSAWIAASHVARPFLVELTEGLPIRSQATRLPWPGAPAGLQYVSGTDLLDGNVAGLPPGPYLDLVPGVALSPRGQLLTAQGALPEPRLGPPLSLAWPDVVLASGDAPPSPRDELIAIGLGPEPRVLARLPVPGPIRGLALDVRGNDATALLAHGDGAAWIAVPVRRVP